MHVLHRSHTGATSTAEGDAFVDTQPRLSKLSIRGLLTLPYRLCNPPPAVGKVRSCGLTPLFKVQLEDVLARKHLPPLSLKDFEEWLLFIEQSPENLYFVLWLREYERKWAAWERRQQRHNNNNGNSNSNNNARVTFSAGSTLSPSLALSFERARATFCTPGAPYELCVPPELLAPFFASPSSDSYANSSSHNTHAAHPHPSTFTPLSQHLHTRLRASLARCVRAAYSNVGTFRATCGIVGGLVITLIGAGLPLLIEFVVQEARGSRWARLAALPGLWLGLTIIVASLRGVCMMVYVFGDFRQLRRFELERPPAPAPPLAVHVQQQMHQHVPGAQDEKAAGARSGNVDARKSSSVSLVSTSSASTSFSGSSSVYSTSSNPTNPMAAHTYPKKPPALHVHTPIRALTAPPRIAVHIPESRSSGFASSNVGSLRRDSVDQQQQQPRRGEEDDEDAESVRTDEDSVEDDSDSDSASEESDHGIYVSPQYAPPDELASLDAQGVQAALAMARRMAGEAQQHHQQQAQVQGAEALEEAGESPVSVSVSVVIGNDERERLFGVLGEATSTTAQAGEKQQEQTQEPAQPQQTARFIPAYPYAAYEYEAERDTWECDSPTSCSGGSAASGSGSGLGSRSGSGRGSSLFVCPVKKRVTALFSSSSSNSGVERQGGEERGEGEDDAGRGPCWSIRTRSRTRSRSSGGRRSRTTSVGSRSVSGASADVDLEKGVVAVDAPAATTSTTTTPEEKQERARGRRRTRRDAEKEADVPFDFDALPPREGRRRTQQQQQAYNFNQAHIDVATLHHQQQQQQQQFQYASSASYPQRATMTDAVAAPEPEGALDRLWAFFCPLKQSGAGSGGFSERLFGVATTVPATGGDLEKAASAAHIGNSRWESSPPPPYAPAPAPAFASSSVSSSSPSSPISPLAQNQLPFSQSQSSSPPNLPAPSQAVAETATASAAGAADTPSSAWQSRFAQAARVPAFGPVTRILSPVVSRAQWEIVVRSFMLAGLLSAMIIGGLLGVPVRR